MSDILDPGKDFNSLSLRDLLEARDLYHLHLMDKQHVVATAVGRYLIRRDDPWPRRGGRADRPGKKPPRTLENSEVRDYSWPCVLVLVDQWRYEDEIGGDFGAHDFVPRALRMPDGTRVPVCVVYAEPVERGGDAPAALRFPDQKIGGGYPLLVSSQKRDHVASVGCLVTDGHDVYALTSRHVTGPPGTPVEAVVGGERVRVGESADRQVTRKPFSEVYREWPGRNVFLNLDAGLVKVDDLTRWTAQVFGIGTVGRLADLSSDNISLRLIDCPVRAHGAASGPLSGRVLGLFYRYKSVGGFEYMADFLIGPRGAGQRLPTCPGDSGTLWLLETGDSRGLMPMAVQWGGHAFRIGENGDQAPYALATSLSTVCGLLEVDVVRDWNLDDFNYWGAVGHFTIATKAIDRVRDPVLKKWMQANLQRISFAAADINKKNTTGLSNHPFVPLADVPDLVWKVGPHKRGGQTAPEHSNHFADMDRKDSHGQTLLEICEANPQANVEPAVWLAYYNDPRVRDESKGLLPFRVWQIYDAMVDSLRAGRMDEFVCAAGILSHYVGDSCQPLHISYRFNGDPDHPVPNPKFGKPKEPATVPRGHELHGAYEGDMVNAHVPEIMSMVDGDDRKPLPLVRGGKGAALATVQLMQDTFRTIDPGRMIDVYAPVQNGTASEKTKVLWKAFGKQTGKVIADGARYLAALWDSAWAEARGADHVKSAPAAFSEEELAALYQPVTFLPSFTLEQIGAHLRHPGAGDGGADGPAPQRPERRSRPRVRAEKLMTDAGEPAPATAAEGRRAPREKDRKGRARKAATE